MTASRIKRVAIGLWVLFFLAFMAIIWMRILAPSMTQTVASTLGQGDYALTATDGTPFTQATLRGTPSAVFFGFTHCPEVCPTTMGDIASWKDELTKDGTDLRAFFVTVDPERDTLGVLKDYVSWAPGITGVTGTPEEIRKAIQVFRIYASKVPLQSGGYTMDHSASVLLFDRKGHLFEPIGYQEGFDRAIRKIKRMLNK